MIAQQLNHVFAGARNIFRDYSSDGASVFNGYKRERLRYREERGIFLYRSVSIVKRPKQYPSVESSQIFLLCLPRINQNHSYSISIPCTFFFFDQINFISVHCTRKFQSVLRHHWLYLSLCMSKRLLRIEEFLREICSRRFGTAYNPGRAQGSRLG